MYVDMCKYTHVHLLSMYQNVASQNAVCHNVASQNAVCHNVSSPK